MNNIFLKRKDLIRNCEWINRATSIKEYPKAGISWEPLKNLFQRDDVFIRHFDIFSDAISYSMNKLMKVKTDLYEIKYFNLNIEVDKDANIFFSKDSGESVNYLLSAMHESQMLYLSIVYAIRKTGGEKYQHIFIAEDDFFGTIEYALSDSTKMFIEEVNSFHMPVEEQ